MPQHREPRSRLNPREERTIPLFVCAGARDVKFPHALFPYGDDCSSMHPCPMRMACFWYSGHDLGGDVEYTDFPEEARMPAAFRNDPYFHCDHFELDTED